MRLTRILAQAATAHPSAPASLKKNEHTTLSLERKCARTERAHRPHTTRYTLLQRHTTWHATLRTRADTQGQTEQHEDTSLVAQHVLTQNSASRPEQRWRFRVVPVRGGVWGAGAQVMRQAEKWQDPDRAGSDLFLLLAQFLKLLLLQGRRVVEGG